MLSLNSHTPTLTVTDPRSLPVRSVKYLRSTAGQAAQAHIDRTAHDAVGRATARWDPRLQSVQKDDPQVPANLNILHSLGGQVLLIQSVDAGWDVQLFGEAGQGMQFWNGRGSQRRAVFDALLRPVAIIENSACTERFAYGMAEPTAAERNQCGRVVRQDDPAGTRHFDYYGVAGEPIAQTQRYLQSLDMPDWPLPFDERDNLLEQAAGARSTLQFNPVGNVLEQTDAQGNRQRFNHTIDGRLREAWLQLKNATAAQRLVHDIHYNAQGQIEQQTAGNQVTSRFDYCPKDGRLNRLSAAGPSDEPLQDLHYVYDPVGNILSLEDKALPVRFFANQRIEPINRYTYDSLYQLIEATGWEAGSANRGPAHLEDPAAVANYRQTYRYDAGGNLLELIHHGPQQHGRVLTAAKHSNRCLPEVGGRPPTEAEIAEAFDASGNLLMLDRGRTLSWDARNQLSHVHMVERTLRLNDTERYVYGADGMRQRKVRTTQTNARTLVSETRYLPGLETRDGDGEKLHVVTVQAGRTTVQVLHWEGAAPQQLANDQYRYTLSDHLGSCSLELDSEARIITRETYHPFGTTAFTQKGDSSEESYRTLRYSGKERDATGLYYYGFRYYVPWLQRWINPDPAGRIDGLNLYRMVRNNPVLLRDDEGLVPTKEEINKSASPSLFQRMLPAWLKKNSVIQERSSTHIAETQVYVWIPPSGGAATANILVTRQTFQDGSNRISYVGANPDGSEEQNSSVHGYIEYVVRDDAEKRVADVHLFDAKPEGKGYGSLLLLELTYDAEEQSIQRVEASGVAMSATGFYLLAGFHPSREGHDTLESTIPGPIDFWGGEPTDNRLERWSDSTISPRKFNGYVGANGVKPIDEFGAKLYMARHSTATWEGETAHIKEQAKLSTIKRGYFKQV